MSADHLPEMTPMVRYKIGALTNDELESLLRDVAASKTISVNSRIKYLEKDSG